MTKRIGGGSSRQKCAGDEDEDKNSNNNINNDDIILHPDYVDVNHLWLTINQKAGKSRFLIGSFFISDLPIAVF